MAASGATPVALDDVMLAMDVVDTLRHRQQLVEQELAGGDRDAALLERLRRTYAAQGIEVPEHVLLDGVAALREDRFAYRPAPPSAARTWATVYVRRGLWFARALAVAALVTVGWLAYQGAVVAPRQAVADALRADHAAVVAVARDAAVRERAEALLTAGRVAVDGGDLGAGREAADLLRELRAQLEQSYELRIVVGADATSGVWRIPEGNSRQRNYYLIVEAVDDRGRRLTLPILNEETARVERVATWGLRVDEATWARVADDKSDDGIIQQRLVGRKVVGDLEPTYTVATPGGAITRW